MKRLEERGLIARKWKFKRSPCGRFWDKKFTVYTITDLGFKVFKQITGKVLSVVKLFRGYMKEFMTRLGLKMIGGLPVNEQKSEEDRGRLYFKFIHQILVAIEPLWD